MKAERIVVDTNVLISAAVSPHSTPARLVALVLGQHRLLFSDASFAELETRLWRPKFDPYLTADIRKRLLHDFAAVADWVKPDEHMTGYCRDADDDKFIHAAQTGGAKWLGWSAVMQTCWCCRPSTRCRFFHLPAP